MKKHILIAIALLLCIKIYSQNSSKNIDFSAVHQHFVVMDVLLSGNEPTENQWNNLFQTAAYKELIRREFKSPTRFQEVFRAAYLPGHTKDVNEILKRIDRKGNFWTAWVTTLLEAYENIPNQKEELIQLIEDYQKLELSEFAKEQSARFLPENHFEDFPKIAFVIFNDSRGYDPIILSLNSYVKTGDLRDNQALDCMTELGHDKDFSFQLLYAHEAFHYYRAKKKEFNFPDNNDPYSSLIWIMNQIENEGIADQIDKQIQYFEPGCFADTREGERYLGYLDLHPGLILKMDSMFVEIANHQDSAKIFSKRFSRMIPRAGHQTGFYMCNAIINEFGEASLKSISRNPYAFFKLYQKAAIKNNELLAFSEKSLDFISFLEKRYLIN